MHGARLCATGQHSVWLLHWLFSLHGFPDLLCSTLCWLFLVCQVPPRGVGVKSIRCPVLASKLKPSRCGPKQTHRPQSVISVTAISGRPQLTFRLSMTIGFPDASQVTNILFPWSYTLSLPAVLCTHIRAENLCGSNTRAPQGDGMNNGFACSGINAKCDGSLGIGEAEKIRCDKQKPKVESRSSPKETC